MKEIRDGKLYNTKTATLIASNQYWDGHNWERNGRNRFLYKTAKGNFFLHDTSQWQGEKNCITPITEGDAKVYYEDLTADKLDYETAFGHAPEEA